jgi:HD-like signal output (HDOD) protein
MPESLRTALATARPTLATQAAARSLAGVNPTLATLATDAEAAGAWGVVELIGQLREKAEAGTWLEFEALLDGLDFAAALIFRHLNPGLLPEPFLALHEINAEREAREHAHWFNAPLEGRCPVTTPADLQRGLDALTGVPVIDSVAAAFEMSATGHPSCLNPLMDIVDRDPALAAQMVLLANGARRTEDQDANPIEEPRLSVSLLGEARLVAAARSLVCVEEQLMHAPPAFGWPQFWLFQAGVARMARHTARYLDLHVLEAPAYTAGLMHDLGKLVLLRLHPFGLQAALDYARRAKQPLREAEKLFLGCTTAEMAHYFATKHGLPPRFASVMRWHGTPEEATADAELVAIVSFARALCLHNRVGHSGDLPADRALPSEETPEWRVLRQSVFPGFNLREFEVRAHQHCHELRLELHGRLKEYAAA